MTIPVHDCTRVEAGIFHAFHTAWVAEFQTALNDGVLPEGYYALAEQHRPSAAEPPWAPGQGIADVLTLQAHPASSERLPPPSPATGGTAVAEAPPTARRRQTIAQPGLLARQRTLAIRHISGHRLVALLEIVSPANKDRPVHFEALAQKAVEALVSGIHLLLVDLFPPGPHDPAGMHGGIRSLLDGSDELCDLPQEEPLTLASYAAGPELDIYLEHLAPGAPLVEMPLFLSPDRYVAAPLESTYTSAHRGMPAFWRQVLEAQPS